MGNKLPNAINIARHNANHCVERFEFFAGKSRANYAEQAAKNWQQGAENWANVEELLRELAQYRNATRIRHPEIVEQVAEGMRIQDYDY